MKETNYKEFDEMVKDWSSTIEQAERSNPIDAFKALHLISIACVRKAAARIEDKTGFKDAIRDIINKGYKSAFFDEADEQQ